MSPRDAPRLARGRGQGPGAGGGAREQKQTVFVLWRRRASRSGLGKEERRNQSDKDPTARKIFPPS